MMDWADEEASRVVDAQLLRDEVAEALRKSAVNAFLWCATVAEHACTKAIEADPQNTEAAKATASLAREFREKAARIERGEDD